ncbi:DUF885 domain-containing protein [Terricaulis sp.]|uniref:DUF885 domain-containing protein n=1 Tax=Terricaulis sp. TaxID=2768686 RepID=UPI003784036E
MRRFLIAAATAMVLLSGCDNSHSAANWGAFQENFINRSFELNPPFGAGQGKHEFDGRLPDWSEAGLAAQVEFLTTSIADAQRFTGLSDAQKYQRDYLVAVARGNLFWLQTADQPHTNPAFYMGSLSPSMYVARPYAAADVRLRGYIQYLRAVPQAAQQIRANLHTPFPPTFVDYGTRAFGGLAEYYQGDGKAAFASVQDAALQTELTEASTAAAQAMTELAQWVESQRATATGDFALGAERFSQMLRDTEMVDIPLEELEAIGRRDLAANQAALREACAQYARGATLPQCMERANAQKPRGGAVPGARAQLAGLRQFIVDHDLVTIPGEEQAMVEESPPFNRQNFAYIDIPGPYETNLPSVYYISPPDPTWDRQTQLDFVPGETELLFVSVHEVWPGHFLNFLHANRSNDQFGRVFVGYAYAEGWAHYTEEMMWDAGLGDGDARTHIGQVSNALRRDCRFLSAILMHTGRMTVQQSEEMFVNECYQDRGNAMQQARRGTYDPAYLNYTMGKLLIRRLREDWVATHGGREGWKAFHDQFLSYGGPPIPLVRQQMMGGEAQAVF